MNNHNEQKEIKYKIPESLSSYLINEIKKYEFLWNTDVADYHNKEKKIETYNIIANSLHGIYNTHGEFNGDEVYKKWQNIRSQYRRHCNKRDSFLSLHGTPLMNKAWKHAESLSFLDKIICRRIRKDDYDIALGGDLMQLVDGDDDSFFDDYHSDSIDSATVLPGTSNETDTHTRNLPHHHYNGISQGISLPVRNVSPSKHHHSSLDIKTLPPKRIKVEPYHGEITSIDVNPYHRVATPTVAVDRLDNFGSYVAAEIRAMAADKRNEAIASVFEVIKRSWTSS